MEIQHNVADCYGVIYLFTDNNNDDYWSYRMFYVGQTIQKLRDRFRQHLSGHGANLYMAQAMERYNKSFSLIEVNEGHYQTKGGEFSIEIISKTSDPLDQDEKEKFYIAEYKTCVLDYYAKSKGIVTPLYGFNVDRGGGQQARNYPSGLTHPQSIYVDPNTLEELIRKGFLSSEIARELDIPQSLINNKIKQIWGDIGITNLTDARKFFGSAELASERHSKVNRKSSPYYKEIDLGHLEEIIKKGFFREEIKEKLEIGDIILDDALMDLGYVDLPEARVDLGSYSTWEQRYRQLMTESARNRDGQFKYVEISKSELLRVLRGEQDVKILAQKYGIHPDTVYKKIKEAFGGMGLNKARRYYVLYPQLDSSFFKTLVLNGLSIVEIDQEFLKEYIYQGLSLEKITYKFQRNDISTMSNFIQKNLGVKISSKQKIYIFSSLE